MMKKMSFMKKFFVAVWVIFCLPLVACTSSENETDIVYKDIQTITVNQESVFEGFALSTFDISMVLLDVTYKPDSDTGLAMKKEQDEAGSKLDYNYTVTMPASMTMVKAEDVSKLKTAGKKTITLIYGKFTVSFVLNLYDDSVASLHKVVFYDEDGVTALSEIQYVEDGGRASQPALNEKKGYTFSGWINRETGMRETFDNILQDTDFIAYYVANTFMVKYAVRYRSLVNESEVYSKTTEKNNKETVISALEITRGDTGKNHYPELPAIDGYTFSGWETEIDETPSSDDSKYEEIYYAVYDRDSYPVTFVYRTYSGSANKGKKYSDKVITQVEYYYSDEEYITEPTNAHPVETSGEVSKKISEGNDYQFINWYVYHGTKKVTINFPYATGGKLTETCFYANYADMNAGSEGLSFKIVSKTDKTCIISGYEGEDDIIVIPEKQVVDSVLCDVIGLEDGIFKNLKIKQFVVSSDNQYFECEDGVLYSKRKDVLMVYPTNSERVGYTIADTVCEISSYAFYEGKYLQEINFPATLLQIDDYAFAECSGLTSLTFPADIASIEEGAFRMTTSSVQTIEFLGNNILSLGDEAFYGLNQLKKINIPASVKTIGTGTFYGCSGLETVTAENSAYFRIYQGALYDYDFRNLYLYPSKYRENPNPEVSVHAECRKILRGAFYYADIGSVTVYSAVEMETYSIVCPSLHSFRIATVNYQPDITEFEQAFGGFLPQYLYIPIGNNAFDDYSGTKKTYTVSQWTGYDNYTTDGFLYERVDENGVSDANGNYLSIIGYRGEETDLSPAYQISGRRLISIAPYAFYGNTTIRSVIVPVTVQTIGDYAFFQCTSLQSVTLSQTDVASISSIGDYAFYGCSSLTSVNFVDSTYVGSFGKYVFDETPFISGVDNEDFLIVCGVLLRYFGSDSTVYMPSTVRYIATDAFKDKGYITTLSMKNATKLFYVDEYAFQNCIGLRELSFPKSIRYVADYAFYGCNYLFSVTYDVKKEEVEVGYYAYKSAGTYYTEYDAVYETFADTELYMIQFMASATEEYDMTGQAFVKEQELEDYEGIFLGWYYDDAVYHKRAVFPMYITENLKLYARFEDNLYNSDGLVYDLNENGTYSVSGYTGSDSFVIVPATYKNVSVTGVMSGVFRENVINFSLPDNITEVEEGAFSQSAWYRSYAGDFVIYDRILIAYKGNATDVVVPSEITMIANGAFKNNTSIRTVVLPDSVSTIGKDIFYGCISLQSIAIGSNVVFIKERAFYGCTSLSEIDWSEATSLTSIAYNAFDNTAWLDSQKVDCLIINNIFFRYFGESDILHIPEGVVTIAPRAFKDNSQLRTVYFPTTLQTIYESAFENCGLTAVNIPNEKCELMFIMSRAFYNCYNLSVFRFDRIKSLSEIQDEAFYLCTSLTTAEFASSLNILGKKSFYGSGLVSVTFRSGFMAEAISAYAFANCVSLQSVLFAGSAVTSVLEEYAFYNCVSLSTYNNGQASIKQIGTAAFYNCISLKTMKINENAITDIGANAFYNVGKNVFATASDNNMHLIGNILLEYNGSEQRVKIPDNVVLIYNSAFEGNTHVNEIVFLSNRNLKRINDRAFYGCTNLATITFPDSLEYVGDNIMDGTQWYTSQLRNNDFVTIGNTLIKYNFSDAQEAVIPETVSTINKNAFSGTSVYNIRIGDNVTLIKEGAFDGIIPISWSEGNQIFEGYTLTMEGENPPTLEDERPFAGCCCIYVDNISILDAYRLNVNWRIQYDFQTDFMRVIERHYINYSVVTGEGESMPREYIHAMYNTKEVIAVETAKKKYEFVGWFLDSTYNYAVSFPLILTEDMTIYAKCVDYSIGSNPNKYIMEEDTVNDCYNIISYHDTVDKKVVIITEYAGKDIYSIAGYLGYIRSADKKYTLYVLNAKGEFEPYNRSVHGINVQTYRQNTVIEEIAFANNCTIEVLGENCFAGMTSLKKITLPAGLKRISANAFAGCTALEEIVFDSDTSDLVIEKNAFKNCESLTRITIPAGVIDIETDAFKACYNLINITMLAVKPIQLGDVTTPFEFNPDMIIYIPNGSYQAYYSAWEKYNEYLQVKKEEE